MDTEEAAGRCHNPRVRGAVDGQGGRVMAASVEEGGRELSGMWRAATKQKGSAD